MIWNYDKTNGQVFHDVAYKAKSREDLLAGINIIYFPNS